MLEFWIAHLGCVHRLPHPRKSGCGVDSLRGGHHRDEKRTVRHPGVLANQRARNLPQRRGGNPLFHHFSAPSRPCGINYWSHPVSPLCVTLFTGVRISATRSPAARSTGLLLYRDYCYIGTGPQGFFLILLHRDRPTGILLNGLCGGFGFGG
jgi:hypothetical protein